MGFDEQWLQVWPWIENECWRHRSLYIRGFDLPGNSVGLGNLPSVKQWHLQYLPLSYAVKIKWDYSFIQQKLSVCFVSDTVWRIYTVLKKDPGFALRELHSKDSAKKKKGYVMKNWDKCYGRNKENTLKELGTILNLMTKQPLKVGRTAWGGFGTSSKKDRIGTLSLGFGEKFEEVRL